MQSSRPDLLDLLADAIAERVVARMATQQRPPEETLTASEVCARLDISRPTLAKLDKEGLPSILVGQRRRYVLAAVLDWMSTRPTTRVGRPPKTAMPNMIAGCTLARKRVAK